MGIHQFIGYDQFDPVAYVGSAAITMGICHCQKDCPVFATMNHAFLLGLNAAIPGFL